MDTKIVFIDGSVYVNYQEEVDIGGRFCHQATSWWKRVLRQDEKEMAQKPPREAVWGLAGKLDLKLIEQGQVGQ